MVVSRLVCLVAALAATLSVSLAPACGVATQGPVRMPSRSVVAARSAARAAYDRMSQAQRIGQLFMTGVPTAGASPAEISALRAQHVGNLILTTGSAAAASTVRTATTMMSADVMQEGVAPFVSTDQEGGLVQRLTGPGMSRMPSALVQGSWSTSQLRTASTKWGRQLSAAGVDLDLAPVADTVPARNAKANAPIGAFDREFGHTPSVVGPHVAAFVHGMRAAGIDTAVKHFPGLGRATGNTDTARGVTDPTTRHDAYLGPFRSGINAGTAFVMVSSAIYPHIDAGRPACFSSTIINGMLRQDLHFGGIVISDSMDAVAVSGRSPAARALGFFRAGGTMLLDVASAHVAPMVRAVAAQARASAWFAHRINADVLAVLRAKAAAGLIISVGAAGQSRSTTIGA
jgi:beta-N-acetylhexosaminidase